MCLSIALAIGQKISSNLGFTRKKLITDNLSHLLLSVHGVAFERGLQLKTKSHVRRKKPLFKKSETARCEFKRKDFFFKISTAWHKSLHTTPKVRR